MARTVPLNLPLEARGSRWEAAIEVVLAGLLAFMPLAMGVVARWSEEVVLAAVTLLAVLLLLRLLARRDRPFVWSWSYLFVLLFVAVAAGQLLPLPAGLVRAVSPHTVQTKAELLGDLPGTGPATGRVTISFCPAGTRHDLALVLAAATVFVVTVNVYRRPGQIKRLLAVVTTVGGAVVLLALLQEALGAKQIYWVVEMPSGDSPRGGPFVNHNDFAQYANLCAGAALGLLLVRLRETLAERGFSRWRDVRDAGLRGPEGRPVWLLAAFLLAAFVAVALSLSRGGTIATVVALAVTTGALAASKAARGRGALVALLGLAAFACVLYFGFDAVYERFVAKDVSTYGGRQQIFAGALRLFRTYPAVGTGLGTHQYVFPMVDTRTGGTLATHAENEYVQAAEETGVVGLLAVAAFVAAIAFHWVRGVRRPDPPVRVAAFGLGFGLLTVLVHSLSDFGQHLPSLACLSAAFCGILVSLSRLPAGGEADEAGEESEERAATGRGGRSFAPARFAGWGAAAAMTAALALRLPAADAARRAEAHWDRATALESGLGLKHWEASQDEYAQLLNEAAAAADLCPDEVRYRYGLNAWRWRSVERFDPPHSPEYHEYAARIIAELHQGRPLCPTYGPPYSLAGQLETFALERPEGPGHIRTGYRLAPVDPACCFVAGRLEAYQQHWDPSVEAFERATKADGTLRPAVVEVYVDQVNRPDLAVRVLGEDWESLFQLADRLEDASDPGRPPDAKLAAQVRQRAESLLTAAARRPDAPTGVLSDMAELAKKKKDYQTAAECYRRALSGNYAEAGWHLELARSLAALGQSRDAEREARIVLSLRPNSAEAKSLLDDLAKVAGTQDDPE